MEQGDNSDFLSSALRESLGNISVRSKLDDLKGKPVVRGPDLSKKQKMSEFIHGFDGIGIQASVLHKAVDIFNQILDWKLEEQDREKVAYDEADLQDFHKRRCMIFLGCSSSIMSAGTRDLVKYLLKYRMVNVFVTTAGGVEEDLIKHFGNYIIRGYEQDTPEEFEKQGNITVPKSAQTLFKSWFKDQIACLHQRQDLKKRQVFTPSMIIRELGLAINDENCAMYWAAKNEVPVFCPAFTDGFIGECLFEYNLENPGFIIDCAKDIFLIDKLPHRCLKSAAIIFGGGVIKHHIMNANLMRNGVDYAVYVNTGSEWEASDSGAKPSEALSWGKIRLDALYAKVYGDANLVAPLLIAGSNFKNKEKYRRDLEYQEFKRKLPKRK
jgi:deoxyhypusine synthase